MRRSNAAPGITSAYVISAANKEIVARCNA